MEDKDREIWIGENRIYIDKDNIVHQALVGIIEDDLANEIGRITLGLTKPDTKIRILMDLNKSGQPSSKARKSFLQIAETKKIEKIALFGLGPVSRVIAAFVMGLTRKDMRFFKNKEEALKWLKE